MKKLVALIVAIPLLASCQNKEISVKNELTKNKSSFYTDWEKYRLYGTPKVVTNRIERNFEITKELNSKMLHTNLPARRIDGGGGIQGRWVFQEDGMLDTLYTKYKDSIGIKSWDGRHRSVYIYMTLLI